MIFWVKSLLDGSFACPGREPMIRLFLHVHWPGGIYSNCVILIFFLVECTAVRMIGTIL